MFCPVKYVLFISTQAQVKASLVESLHVLDWRSGWRLWLSSGIRFWLRDYRFTSLQRAYGFSHSPVLFVSYLCHATVDFVNRTTYSFPLLTAMEVDWIQTIFKTSSGINSTETDYASIAITTVITIPGLQHLSHRLPCKGNSELDHHISYLKHWTVPVQYHGRRCDQWCYVCPGLPNVLDPTWSRKTISSSTTTSTPGSTEGNFTLQESYFPPVTHTKGSPWPTCNQVTGCSTYFRGMYRVRKLLCSGISNKYPYICAWLASLALANPIYVNWWHSNSLGYPNESGERVPSSECEATTYSPCSTSCVCENVRIYNRDSNLFTNLYW